MTQDFAKKPRRKTPRAPKKKAKPSSQTPGWVWLFTGTVLGAFIMFLTYLSGIPANTSAKPAAAQQATAKPKAQNTPKPRADDGIPKPRFDFYQLLEEDKVESPRSESSPTKTTAAATTDPIEYLMQVGSFKQSGDADRLRAELLLMNLDAQIETFKKRNNEVYYRVLVGPYPNRANMSKDRSTLASNKFDVWVITRKTDA